MSGSGSGTGNVLDLGPWEITVRSAVQRREAYALLERQDADQAIKSLTELELYYAVKALGVDDAAPFLAVIEPPQIRALIDLDVWHRDRADLDDLLLWLVAFRESSPERLKDAIGAVDKELLALLLRRRLLISRVGREDTDPDPPEWVSAPPDEILPLVETPDRRFVIAARAFDEQDEIEGRKRPIDEEDRKAILELVELLYRDPEPEVIAGAMRTAMDDLSSDLEETALHFRQARLEDLGFPPLDRAMDVYARVDPEATLESRAPHPTPSELRLPSIHASRLSEGLLRQALRALGDAQLVRAIEAELVPLSNSVLVADLVEPGDLDRLSATLDRVRANIELALAWGGQGDPINIAVERIERLPLRILFAAGYSITLRLSTRARALLHHPAFQRIDQPLALLEEADRALLQALTQRRPLYSTVLDAERPPNQRPISTPADVARIEEALGELEGLLAAAAAWSVLETNAGLPPVGIDPPQPERSLDLLMTTLAANAVLEGTPALVPLGRTALARLATQAEGGRLPGAAVARALDQIAERSLSPAGRARLSRALKDLAETLAPLAGRRDVDPRFVGGVLREIA